MIELSDFIAEALASIVQGIRNGQKSEVGDHIAPLIQGKDRNAHGNFHLKDDKSNQATPIAIMTALVPWGVCSSTLESSNEP